MKFCDLTIQTKNSRKAASKMLSLYWFAILVIIAGGIFAMVVTFYGHPYDIRPIEADILSDKTADCLSQKGELNKDIFNTSSGNFSEEFKEDFLKECGLNFNYTTGRGRSNYYTEVLFYEADNLSDSGKITEKSVFEIKKGNKNWLEGCDVEEEYSRAAKCSEKRLYSVVPSEIPEKGEKQYLIKIVSVIGKINENVK